MGKPKPRPSKRKMKRLHYGREWPRVTKTYEKEIKPIVKTLRNPRLNRRTRESLQNYLVIRLVSMTDYYFTNIVRRLVDEEQRDASNLYEGNTLQEAAQRGKYTAGQTVATQFNYSNYEDIQKVLSELLGFDFMAMVEALDRKDPYHYVKDKDTIAIFLHNNWSEFRNMFELRDDIAHEMKDSNLSREQALSLADSAMNFLDAASWVCHPQFSPQSITTTIRVK